MSSRRMLRNHPVAKSSDSGIGGRLEVHDVATENPAGCVASEAAILGRVDDPGAGPQPKEQALEPRRPAHEHLDLHTVDSRLGWPSRWDRLHEPGRGRVEGEPDAAIVGAGHEDGE